MKKSTLLLLAVAAFAGQAYAHKGASYVEVPKPKNLFQGFYVTVGGGGTAAQVDIDDEGNLDIANLVFAEFVNDAQTQANSWAALVGLGYNWQFGRGVIGIEFTAGATGIEDNYGNEMDINVADFNVASLVSSLDTKLRNDFAFILKPGFVIKRKTMLYAFFGPRWGNFETELETDVFLTSLISGTSSPIASDSQERSGYRFGLTGGVGIESFVADHFTIGLEYAYTNYGNVPAPDTFISTIGDTGMVEGVLVTIDDDPDVEVATNTIMLDFTFHF